MSQHEDKLMTCSLKCFFLAIIALGLSSHVVEAEVSIQPIKDHRCPLGQKKDGSGKCVSCQAGEGCGCAQGPNGRGGCNGENGE